MFKKTGPYFLRPKVVTAVIPQGIFLRLTEIDNEGAQVEVLVHPYFSAAQPGIEADAKITGSKYINGGDDTDCYGRTA